MIALSILHGGPGPAFLAPSVIDYLFGGLSMVTPLIEDIPDTATQDKIKQVGNQCLYKFCSKLKYCHKIIELYAQCKNNEYFLMGKILRNIHGVKSLYVLL